MDYIPLQKDSPLKPLSIPFEEWQERFSRAYNNGSFPNTTKLDKEMPKGFMLRQIYRTGGLYFMEESARLKHKTPEEAAINLRKYLLDELVSCSEKFKDWLNEHPSWLKEHPEYSKYT